MLQWWFALLLALCLRDNYNYNYIYNNYMVRYNYYSQFGIIKMVVQMLLLKTGWFVVNC